MPNSNPKKQVASGFSEAEREAMKARAKELRDEARANKSRAAGEKAVQEAIAAMSGNDKTMATKIHEIVTTQAPDLMPKTWYGMPAYAKNNKVVCFFQAAGKFKARYASFGFDETANLDDGNMWPTTFALKKLTKVEEKKIAELVKQAMR